MDLAAAGLLPAPATSFLAGQDLRLLSPLRFLPPGSRPAPRPHPPSGPAPARGELAAALAVSNRGYGHPGADRLSRRFADPATRVVVTGQQPGLLGGPLYGFAKMVAATLWAEALEAAGEPAVAVFWVATEDHDFAEVSKATVPTPAGPRSFSLGDDPQPLAPVGMRSLGPGVSELLRALAEAIPGEPYAEWLRQLGGWYRPDARFGEAFCRLMAHMLGERCPLLIDAMQPALKAAQRPWLERLVTRRREVEEALERREREIVAAGYDLKVSPQRVASPLFLLHRGERRRIEWKEDGYVLRGREDSGGSVGELLGIIADNPGVVSPGVLARPALQDAVLGSSLFLVGPGEISYLTQAAAVYPVLEVEPPCVALRPQTLVLEGRLAGRLAETGLTLADILSPREALDGKLASFAGEDFVSPVRRRVAEALADLGSAALAADPGLERPLGKTCEQVLRALDLFAEKATAAAARGNEVLARRVDQLREACLPGGQPQERVISSAHFQGRYGAEFAASFHAQLTLDPVHLQVIRPS